MGKSSFFGPETISLHTGYEPDPAFGSRAVPVYQTTSYVFETVDEAAALFNIEKGGHIYSRMTNPTVAVLEQRIAALEGGVGALALSSGQSASAISVQNLARAGDNIVCSTDVYGGTFNLFSNTLKDQGIEVRFADPSDPENFRKLTDDNTRLEQPNKIRKDIKKGIKKQKVLFLWEEELLVIIIIWILF